MKHYAMSLLVWALVPACASREVGTTKAGAAGEPTACTPEAECNGCTACFDACLCGGGTAARCAESCNAPGADAGSDGGAAARAPYLATLVTDPFDIPAGQEYFQCQNFSNPLGKDVVVLATESFMTAGSHHMFVFVRPGVEDGPLSPCSGLEFSDSLHLAQRSQQRSEYPPGVGRFFSSSQGLRIQIHYLNASTDTVHTEIAVTIRADDPEAVPTHASGIFINTLNISVPPHGTGSADQSCFVPSDANVFTAASHMHQHGVHFTARADDGQLIYETNEWAEPEPWTFTPPRKVTGGSSINIHCDYRNDTDQPLGFGESAATNEMCILAGGYYPAKDGESITCLF